jgi:glycosyltransferase involved in cell wall biosynthesis
MTEGFSVIIPTYNEEKILAANVKRLMKFLDGLRKPYEIIVSDNGSTDRTTEIAKSLAGRHPKKVKLVRLAKRGVGYAFKAAVAAARYDKLISIDADLTVDYRSFIPECARLLRTSSMVVGSKFVGSQRRPASRMLMSGVYIALARLLLGVCITDHSIGAKGYIRSDIRPFLGDVDAGSFYVTAMAYRISKAGKRIVEIPVSCDDRRPSRFSLPHEVAYRLERLVLFWLREKLA